MGVLLGGKSPAPSTLLAAFVLSVCFFSTEAFIKRTDITMDPPNPVAGGKVHLIPHDLSPAPVICRWFRGEDILNNTILIFYFYPEHFIWNATAFTWRETMRSNCTLEIVNLNYNDTANYTVLIEGPLGFRMGIVELVIDASPPVEPGKQFSCTIAGILLATLGSTIILTTAVVLIKGSPRSELPRVAEEISPGVKQASRYQGGKGKKFPSPVKAHGPQAVVKVEDSMESGGWLTYFVG
ncbi:uncharacterized protein LOC103281924 [Anolis carolinensis]|uniref:uncharacterized protein LOC103281924 n=1 Tax=Anolis carolinensis TaxID=28377 RepID=UPI0004626062|nr:PREDICTED: uncharacterized protein LOC103281924 [Anolis carolinensis]|eukprot:XP_008122503.1 PREDICTED: uncharacterized protein LOC103281924 [Anolis carolinensis]